MPDPPDILIRSLTSADVAKVRELHDLVLPLKYPTSFFVQLLLQSDRVCFAAYESANPTPPIAFISASLRQPVRPYGFHGGDQRLRETKDSPHIEILTLGVLPAYQHRGLARLLIRRVYEHFQEPSHKPRDQSDGTLLQANVATSNIPALTFYERMGMRIASDVIHNLYRSCRYGSRDGYLVAGVVYF